MSLGYGDRLAGRNQPSPHAWVAAKRELVLNGQRATVISQLRHQAAEQTWSEVQRKAIQRTIGGYERNATYMRYDHYVAQGWPIGTGVVEGACGHLVKDRMAQAGMRWTQAGAQAMLDLRAVRLNGDWDAATAGSASSPARGAACGPPRRARGGC